jgi:phosphohistidine phosphatase
MRLYFLRHADAAYGSLTPDAERPLSPKGVAQAETIARILPRLDLQITDVLSSTYLRAKQTAEIVSAPSQLTAPHLTSYLAPDSKPKELFDELRHYSQDSHLLLVSHEPFLSSCIGSLILFNSFPKISLGKGALACVQLGGQPQSGAGVLLWLMQYEQLEILSKRSS